MTTHEASSSSSSKSKHWNYDVFLSFRGVDTHNGFTGHLHAALRGQGYQAYIDEDYLESGEDIKEKLFRVIKEARISIIVFSKSYADSSWCLDELVKIMECRDKLGQRVLPIFYHVDPSHVGKQNGYLAQAFQKHEEGIREEKDDEERKAKQERVKQWRKALTYAANLPCFHLKDNGHEAKFIAEIVGQITREWLPSANKLDVAKHPVGINSRVQDIITYLSNGGSDVSMVGICGMGGLGKTTAAKAIYNQSHQKFEFKSFLANVSEYDLVDLQETLVSDILELTMVKLTSVHQGISVIKKILQRACVLIIIDNVDKVRPDEVYLELLKKFVSYFGGLPLALEVLGSSMIGKTLTEWKSELLKLKKFPEWTSQLEILKQNPDEGIMKSPRASEEALTHTEGDNNILPFLKRLFDGGINGRKIGSKLMISRREISKGSNGTIVLEGVYDGRHVAVKRLVLAHYVVAFKEIQNLIASDRHPNIVRWYGVDYDKDFVYLSLERCICNLDDLIQICPNSSQNPVAGEEDAKRVLIGNEVRLWEPDGFSTLQLLKLMRDVVSGLEHLHKMRIIHRDLKPQNVLLIKERTLCAVLSDMGISKRLSGDRSSLGHLATGCGSSGWQPPEQLLGGRQTRAVDMFSLGCLLFYCITGGRHPFGDQLERDINIVKNKRDLFLVEHIPEAADLISRLLDPTPEKRPKASEVLLHPLFWDSETRLSFLRDFSDMVEDRAAYSVVLGALESIAPKPFDGNWDKKMEPEFIANILKRRPYEFDSVQALLRAIRNKSNHYSVLPKNIQELVGPFPIGFYFYFSSRFPRLLIEVYKVVCENCREEECLGKYFKSKAD